MASSVVDLKLLNDGETIVEHVSCHLIPCTVHHDGVSQVSKYFLPSIKQESEGHLTSSFRGRPLAGQQMNLPEDYIGLNIVSDGKSSDCNDIGENCETTWKVKHTFDKFTYWNFDKTPSANDKLQQAFAFFDIANAINSDSTDEQGKSAVKMDLL